MCIKEEEGKIVSEGLTFNLEKLLSTTEERARFEERRLLEEKENKESTVKLLAETERKNQLLQEVLDIARFLVRKTEQDFAPLIDTLEQKINVLVSIQGLLVQYMVPKSKESDKTVKVLADLVKDIRGSNVNITADSVSSGSDMNIGDHIFDKHMYHGD
jgi:hypothetical protein